MAEIRQQMGDGPVYLSFDIDALDPCYAPATGLPQHAWVILCMRLANERRRYVVTSSLISWAHS